MTPDDAYNRAFAIVWEEENGGVRIVATDDPSDPGGYTRGGVALNRHPELTRTKLDAMGLNDFRAFYRIGYWDIVSCGAMPWPVSAIVFDGEINQGIGGARALQDALGVIADGVVGPVTLRALTSVDPVKIAAITLRNRSLRYRALSTYARFGKGWDVRLFTLALKAGIN